MRTHTPPIKNPDGSTTTIVHIMCNGCGQDLGDATNADMKLAVAGIHVDRRIECGCQSADSIDGFRHPVLKAVADQRDAVRRLHHPSWAPAPGTDSGASPLHDLSFKVCAECSNLDGGPVIYPCPTAKAAGVSA